MRIEDFDEFKSGILVPITVEFTGEQDWAFVPNPLPPSFEMTDGLWSLVAQAYRAIGELNGGSDSIVSPRLLLQPLQQNEALESSKIEGTYATPQQLLLAFEDSANDAGKGKGDAWKEVTNYFNALRAGYDDVSAGEPFGRDLIKKLHRILLTGVRGSDHTPGEFRTRQVYVRGSETSRRFIPPPADFLPDCLGKLDSYLVSNDTRYDPLIRAFLVHYQFEAIHPFSDGNGRVGRLLLSLTIHRWLNLDVPWLYLSEYFHSTRSKYLACLYQVSTRGAWQEWIEYCLKGTIKQATVSLEKLRALNKLRKEYRRQLKKEKRLPEIVERLFTKPAVRVVDVQKDYNVTYETARSDIAKLVQRGILCELPSYRPKAYFAPQIFKIAYSDTE